MKTYEANSGYFFSAMQQMSGLRQQRSFCDITLTVGQGTVQAHRCVLAAGSSYFNSLFCGKFIEASMANINLSEVTSDVKALEVVVDFIYTGHIEIDDSNLGVILKLATFFLIEPLREFCLLYMVNGLNLSNCLRFYLLAVQHSLPTFEAEVHVILMSRFHDCVIYQDNLAQLVSPDDVQFLLSNDIFQHCSASSMLHFSAKWLHTEITDKRVSVANQILDKVPIKSVAPAANSNLSKQQKRETVQILEALSEKKCAGVEKFLKKAQLILAKVFPDSKPTNKTYNLRLAPSSSKKPCTSTDIVVLEPVVVILAPRQNVIEAMEFKPANFHITATYVDPVFTLCCYVPRTKQWYHMRDFEAEGVMGDISEELYFGGLVSAMYRDELVLLYNGEVHMYNLRTRTWRKVLVADLDDTELEVNEINEGYEFCLVTGNNNNSLYLIVKISIFNHMAAGDPAGEYFRGFKLHHDGHTWISIFRTDIERTHACCNNEMQAQISTVSNKLIFTHSPFSEDGYYYVFIVNLNEPEPTPQVIMKKFVLSTDKMLAGTQIIQTRTHFYIAYDGSVVTDGAVEMIYEYKFNSLTLTRVKNASSMQIYRLNGPDEDTFPCLDELVVSDSRTIWSFEGNKNCVSFLYEVNINRNKNVIRTEHVPPPFGCVTGMFVGELDTDLIDRMTPVTRYLHNDRKCPSLSNVDHLYP